MFIPPAWLRMNPRNSRAFPAPRPQVPAPLVTGGEISTSRSPDLLAGSAARALPGPAANLLRGILGGGALGAGLGVAALAIPGVGPLVAAGAIAASAVPGAMAIGAAAGAAAGTLNETLKSHGVDDEDVAYYDERIRGGSVFVSVDTNGSSVDADAAREILYRNGGHSSSRARSAAQI